MASVPVILTIGLGGLVLACARALWRKVNRVEEECARRVASIDDRLKSLHAQVVRLEKEVTRQGIEIEDQGIQLETRSYWED